MHRPYYEVPEYYLKISVSVGKFPWYFYLFYIDSVQTLHLTELVKIHTFESEILCLKLLHYIKVN